MKREQLFRTILFLLLALATIGALEIGSTILLRYMDQGTDPVAGGRHLYHAFRSHQLNPSFVRAFDSHGLKLHSDDGFRSNAPISKDKPDGVFRILMLGGSALYGIGAEAPYPRRPSLRNDETISHFLQLKLNERMQREGRQLKVEVVNAGVVAYKTWQHLVYFNETLYEYQPDLLVFFDGHNDFYHYEVYNNWQAHQGGSLDLTAHFDHRGPWFTALTVVRSLATHSRFFMVLEKKMQQSWPAVPEHRFAQEGLPRTVRTHFPENVEQILRESIFKSYVQFQALGKLFDFDMMVFLQPQIALEATDRLSDGDRQVQAITREYEINPRRAEIRPFFPREFDRYGIAFTDLAEIATEQTRNVDLYLDYCHLTAAGAALVAERMAPAVWTRMAARFH